VKCKWGGKLKRSFTEVEFFGIDFGLKQASAQIVALNIFHRK
jgi:hypothetical protein